MHFNISRLIVGALVWAMVQDVIKLSRSDIQEDRTTILKEVLILGAIITGLVMYNR